jgi:hypothetical protein
MTTATKITNVTNVASYKSPMLAVLNGRPVRLIATGDAPGHSPVFQYVNEQGKVAWDESESFTVIDPQFLPPSQETLREVGRVMTGTSQSTR